ncbi:MAG: aromatic-ring-hydroxylating dioxygenase subunit beta [Cyanobacteriota bacterium]
MSAAHLSAQRGLEGVKALYDDLAAERDWVLSAPLATPQALVADVERFLALEARLLDAGHFERWLQLWDPQGWYWIPLRRDSHPGTDQALFLDDWRRLQERVWRLRDPYAWGIQPLPEMVRAITSVEAWEHPHKDLAEGTIVASSTLILQVVAGSQPRQVVARQIHRLRPKTEGSKSEGFEIVRKTLLIPELARGSQHLGWLL